MLSCGSFSYSACWELKLQQGLERCVWARHFSEMRIPRQEEQSVQVLLVTFYFTENKNCFKHCVCIVGHLCPLKQLNCIHGFTPFLLPLHPWSTLNTSLDQEWRSGMNASGLTSWFWVFSITTIKQQHVLEEYLADFSMKLIVIKGMEKD